MGAPDAVEILHRRELATALPSRCAELEKLYAEAYCNPDAGLKRGLIDALIDPLTTRAVIARSLVGLRAKRERLPRRKHDNSPL